MVSFANAPVLILGLLPVGLFFWWRNRPRASIRFADLRMAAGLDTTRSRLARHAGALLRALAVLCAIAAAAGPRTPDLKTRIPTEGVAIVIVLDASGSMETENAFLWKEGSPKITRREAASRAFHLFVQGGDAPDGTRFEGRSSERGADAIGLVTFTNYPQPICPPTLNHQVLLRILDERRPVSVRDEGSNVGDAIAQAVIMLEKAEFKRRAIILLSDGESNFDRVEPEGRPLKPRQAAQLAANLGVRVYSIDTGGDPPPNAKPDEIKQREDGRKVMRAVADLTGGRSFEANNGRELLEVCRMIDSLEKQPILSNTFRRHHELYPWFAGAALALLVLTVVAELTVLRRLP